MEIVRLNGTSKRLYELVAPLVMSASALRQNNNYPFRTSSRHVWYVATERDTVVGFMPLKPTATGFCIDNYYLRGEDGNTALQMLGRITADTTAGSLSALAHKRHVPIFEEAGFRVFSDLTNYSRMDYSPENKKAQENG